MLRKIWYEHNILKQDAAFFAEYICDDINALIRSSKISASEDIRSRYHKKEANIFQRKQ